MGILKEEISILQYFIWQLLLMHTWPAPSPVQALYRIFEGLSLAHLFYSFVTIFSEILTIINIRSHSTCTTKNTCLVASLNPEPKFDRYNLSQLSLMLSQTMKENRGCEAHKSLVRQRRSSPLLLRQ